MEYKIIRSRRKSVAIEITPRGDILVRCPVRMSRQQIQQFLDSKAHWIQSHLSRIAAQPQASVLTPQEHQALIRTAKEYFSRRVRFWADRMGLTFGRITVRSQHTRWGSCSAAGNLSFNCLLMLAPEEIRDYVIVHELCHRTEMNHSSHFWAQVELHLPDYQSRRKWLRDNGSTLLAKLPRN